MGAEAQRATIFITVKIIRILVNTNYFHPPRAPVGSRGSSVWSSGTSRGVRISGAPPTTHPTIATTTCEACRRRSTIPIGPSSGSWVHRH